MHTVYSLDTGRNESRDGPDNPEHVFAIIEKPF